MNRRQVAALLAAQFLLLCCGRGDRPYRLNVDNSASKYASIQVMEMPGRRPAGVVLRGGTKQLKIDAFHCEGLLVECLDAAGKVVASGAVGNIKPGHTGEARIQGSEVKIVSLYQDYL